MSVRWVKAVVYILHLKSQCGGNLNHSMVQVYDCMPVSWLALVCWGFNDFTSVCKCFNKFTHIVWMFLTSNIKSWNSRGGCPTLPPPPCLPYSPGTGCHVWQRSKQPLQSSALLKVWINCCSLVKFNSCLVAHLHFPAWLVLRLENVPDSLPVMNLLVPIKHFFISVGFFQRFGAWASVNAFFSLREACKEKFL